jgi:hypothetical protein
MNPAIQITTVRIARLTIALAGLMLSAFLLVSRAQASCGDYVFVRNAQGQLVRASTLMNGHRGCSGPNCRNTEQAAVPDIVDLVPAETIPIKVPCRGPNCYGRSEQPASPAPLPSPIRVGQDTSALPIKLNDGNYAEGYQLASIPSANAYELHYPRSIFHPPR